MLHSLYWLIRRFLPLALLVVLGGVFLFRIAFWRPEASQKPAWTRTELGAIEAALGRFEARTGRLPTTTEGLAALAGAGARDLWSAPDLESLPLDAWGREFHYVSPPAGGGADYEITSAGADGRWGTRDDIRARGRKAVQGLTISGEDLGLDWLLGLTIVTAGLLVIRGLRGEARPRRPGALRRGTA